MLASCTKSCIQCSTNKANNISERRLTYHRWYCDSPCKALEHLLGFFAATRGLQMLHHKTTRLQNWKNPPNCWSYWHPESTWAQRSKSAGKKKRKGTFYSASKDGEQCNITKKIIWGRHIIPLLTVKNRDGRGVILFTWIIARRRGRRPSLAAT